MGISANVAVVLSGCGVFDGADCTVNADVERALKAMVDLSEKSRRHHAL